MAFLLGSLTSGLFGGMRDVSDIMNNWETLKQRRMETKREQDMMDAADKTKAAMEHDYNTKTPAATSTTTTASPTTTNAPEAPDLNSVPLPDFMKKAAKAISPKPEVPAPTDAFGTLPTDKKTGAQTTSALPAAKESSEAASKPPANFNPNDPLNFSGIGHAIASGAKSLASGLGRAVFPNTALPDNMPPSPVDAFGTLPPVPTSQPTQAVPVSNGFIGVPPPSPQQPVVQPRTTAPNYLPPMSSAAPTAPAATPSLGIGQAGLGAQILAALNPVYGPRA